MNRKEEMYWGRIFWIGAMLQIFMPCMVLFFLRNFQIDYPSFLNLLFLAAGGTSSFVWGVIVSKKSRLVKEYKRIILDFFGIRQPVRYYVVLLGILLWLFGPSIFSGNVLEGILWYTFIICFFQSILFGGIEEVGWRYTFQNLLEKRMPYETASILTFFAWGFWHYMYFYIADTLSDIEHISFLIGLLVSCFVLGAIYRITHSLWLCVFYHCLLNTFSQTLQPCKISWVAISGAVCIVLVIVGVRYVEKHKEIQKKKRNHKEKTWNT